MFIRLKTNSKIAAGAAEIGPSANRDYVVFGVTFPDGEPIALSGKWALSGDWEGAQYLILVGREGGSEYLLPFPTTEFEIVEPNVPRGWIVDRMGGFKTGVLYVGYEGLKDAAHIERFLDGEPTDVALIDKVKSQYESSRYTRS